MARLIGNDSALGFYASQVLAPDDLGNEFNLTYRVTTTAGILVVYDGIIQQPDEDYSLSEGGSKIVFDFVPSSALSLYIIFL